MPLSRRALIGMLSVGATAVTAGAFRWVAWHHGPPRPVWPPALDAAPTGAISADGLRTLYHRHIVREVLALFARTDAWILLGYEAWPGTARGFTRYVQAPPRRA